MRSNSEANISPRPIISMGKAKSLNTDKVVANFDWFHKFSYCQLYHVLIISLWFSILLQKPENLQSLLLLIWAGLLLTIVLLLSIPFSVSPHLRQTFRIKLNFCRILPYWASYVFGNSKRKIQELSAKLDSLLSNDYVTSCWNCQC